MKGFYVVFGCVVVVTILAGALAAGMAAFGGDTLSAAEERVLNAMTDVMKLGSGAIFGMLGRRSVIKQI